MAVYGSAMASKTAFAAPAASPAVTAPPSRPAPAGTFLPGTKVQVGSHRVVIERYLSEGGFAHVYVVQLPRPVDGRTKAVLKRVAVPDKEHLANMRTEVETMKKLRGQNKHIVKYIDSHASQLKGGGYEVFLLMEFCQGGGLIDFMNTRLQNRLTEPEILEIFTDIAEGLACMHYLNPPLLHRDLKVENVLISTSGNSKVFKLCDFGSTAPPRPAATSAAEARLIDDEIQRHTTLQYRSPEMIDVYRKLPIDEKSDIWALGVFLYKLCYYTTPFEEVGQMAILNAKFKYPPYPRFSDQIKLLIATMLREKPSERPNIYQVLQKACQLTKRELPVRDIYAHRSRSESGKDHLLASATASHIQSPIGATLAPSSAKKDNLPVPQVEPMRRGRPSKPVSHNASPKPSPSPLRVVDATDPFQALDGGGGGGGGGAAAAAAAGAAGTTGAAVGAVTVDDDEFASKFPTLDDFALMTDPAQKKFQFETQSGSKSNAPDAALAQRVTNALADEAFARSSSPPKPQPPAVLTKPNGLVDRIPSLERKDWQKPATAASPATTTTTTTTSTTTNTTTTPAVAAAAAAAAAVTPTTISAPLPQRPSTMVSTGTMTSPAPTPPPVAKAPIWKVPQADSSRRPSSVQPTESSVQPEPKEPSRLARLLQEDASRSQGRMQDQDHILSPTSSRPSLEGSRPTVKDAKSALTRTRSLNLRNLPVSVNVGNGSARIQDSEMRRPDYNANFVSAEAPYDDADSPVVETESNPNSAVEFLKELEGDEKERRSYHKRLSSGSLHSKRSSLPQIAVSGTKLLAGRFGDAFKIFEGNSENGGHSRNSSRARDGDARNYGSRDGHHSLTPIAGSEATDLSEDRLDLAETEDLSPEMRRELEKRQLEAEEKRVASAAAAYRERMASQSGTPGGPVGKAKAASIQSKVQSLLSENARPVQKTASGYGKYTHEPQPHRPSLDGRQILTKTPSNPAPVAAPKPSSAAVSAAAYHAHTSQPTSHGQNRPSAPPKPRILRTSSAAVAAATAAASRQPKTDDNASSPDDWETKFNQRYPSLSGIQLVETAIDPSDRRPVKVREL